MNGGELKTQQKRLFWTNLNLRERVSSRWHSRGPGTSWPLQWRCKLWLARRSSWAV